jgi:hypothetical protein
MKLENGAPKIEPTSNSTDDCIRQSSSSNSTDGIRQSLSSHVQNAGAAKVQETTAVLASVAISNAITPWVTEAAKNAGQSLARDGLVSTGSLAVAGVLSIGYAGAGYPSTAGELAGGFVGKKLGKGFGGKEGGRIGKEIGAVGGATTVGATAGAVVGGPIGALGGASAGLVGYGLGKITGRVVDKVAKWEGLAQHTAAYKLRAGKGSCDRDAAAFCIVTEEGIGSCYCYCFVDEADAQRRFNEWMCSRILFRMEGGCILEDIRRGGWPWHQASILKAAGRLRLHKARMPQNPSTYDSTVINRGQNSESIDSSSSSSSSISSSNSMSDNPETASRRTMPDEFNAIGAVSPASSRGVENADSVPRGATLVAHRQDSLHKHMTAVHKPFDCTGSEASLCSTSASEDGVLST